MGADEFIPNVHFRELHLLPRIIFCVGAVFFVGSFFSRKSLVMGSAGLAIVFGGTLYNLVVDLVLERVGSGKWKRVMIVHCLIATILAVGTSYLAYQFYRESEPLLQLKPQPFYSQPER